MDRDELARVIEEAEIAAGCFTVPAVRLAVAAAIASWFREYLGREETVEAIARALATAKGIDVCNDASYRHSTFGPLARAALTSIGGQDG